MAFIGDEGLRLQSDYLKFSKASMLVLLLVIAFSAIFIFPLTETSNDRHKISQITVFVTT